MSYTTLKHVLEEFCEDNLMPSVLFDDIIKDVKFDINDDEKFYNPVYIGFDNFDNRHAASMEQPIYLNDYDFNIESDRIAMINMLRTEYEGNNFATVGSCACGAYRKNMYVNTDFICDNCHTPVVKPLSSNFTTKVWLRVPAHVSGFINPAIYDAFLKKLKIVELEFNIADYWMDKSLRKQKVTKNHASDKKKADVRARIERFSQDIGVPFGYNEFIENIDKIITSLLNNDIYRILKGKKDDRQTYCERYLEFWERYKEHTISKVFPVPNKIMSIVETDNRNRYYYKEQVEVNRLFQTIGDMYKENDPRSVKNPEIMAGLYPQLVDALSAVRGNALFGKKGTIRYQAGAGRLPFTGRSVISGQSGVCRSDTAIVPWEFGITCLDKHLTNWLYRRGYPPLRVKEIIRNAANKICPIVDEFLTWVEDNRYAIAILGRNPSIQYLSARAVFVRFNRDLEDKSIRVPITTVKHFGADFDGYIGCRLNVTKLVNSYV